MPWCRGWLRTTERPLPPAVTMPGCGCGSAAGLDCRTGCLLYLCTTRGEKRSREGQVSASVRTGGARGTQPF